MRIKKKEGEERKREEEKEKNETGTLEEDVKVLFRWMHFGIFSQGGDLESCGCSFLSCFCFDKLEDLFYRELDTRVEVRVVPDVTDVLVSLSSVVTEFCDGFSCCSD